MRKLENEGMRKKGTSYKLAPAEGNERIKRLANGVKANNARNINNTTKGNGWGGLFRRVG